MGAEKAKERRPRAESTLGTTSRHLLFDRRVLVLGFGTRRSDRYAGDLKSSVLKVRVATLKRIRCSMGSQCSFLSRGET